jgi:hypothetical protein
VEIGASVKFDGEIGRVSLFARFFRCGSRETLRAAFRCVTSEPHVDRRPSAIEAVEVNQEHAVAWPARL